MLDLIELEQLAAFARLGTLSKAAETLHISQPTLTRSMRHIEEAFGVPLFCRGKNRIGLNETGRLAAKYAQKLLFEAEKAVQAVQAFDRSQKTIAVCSCAPAPLWTLLPSLAQKYPENTVSSQITGTDEVLRAVQAGQCDIGILPAPCPDPSLTDRPYIREKLFACACEGSGLAGEDAVSFARINGFNCLLRDQIGFWTGLCRQKMPASRFLIQTDEFEFMELVRSSTLLCFATDIASTQNALPPGRVLLPVLDPEADVTYHLICQPKKKALIETASV